MNRWITILLLVILGICRDVLAQRPASADDQAKFLAGVALNPASSLAPLQRQDWYHTHVREFVPMWRRFDAVYFGKMRSWAAHEVLPKTGNPSVLYYLFAGPDFINAYALFPDVPVYILGGLEPVGSMMAPEALDASRLANGLANLRMATSMILKFSHFITKDMKAELERTDFRGVLPILYAFLAFGGTEILSVNFVGIDSSGNLRDLVSLGQAKGLLPGVRITFRKNSSVPPQAVYYVQANVENGALGKGAPLLAWMTKFGPALSYLKSASYLMHEGGFSRVRQFLLDRSRAILQDDSGIPLRNFVDGRWRIYLYGEYNGTLEIFRKYYQPDLVQAFGGNTSGGLPFGTGYKWQPGESNLMLAVRESAVPRAQPVRRELPPVPIATPRAMPENATDIYPAR